ncbi:glutamyl-tRNA synthetase [Hyperthermus butylicus DSM 5456]|uniref:Glutamate--tRNA ligase n=1 Tax=Hyperthermus butylicus (strain DSM 5456 / JCM 9403 / PLM1-5) TaxID=415426 RepID=SYE_HYPBU|nr:RecName: Full=Glutamate--tRNA ligase; AltName: Full=Glutamyl-tRNA synthetase; Short=GluRS [Hyperthermus butylicus DSM 5456]ABM80402.1 glutamyl-tRNA synthetase [Hyperthermus butylicus DSM 5456]
MLNAVGHGGRAAVGPVMGKIMAERPDLRPQAKQIVAIVREVVEEVNKLSLEEQKRLLEEKYSWVIEKKLQKRREAVEKKLPPLPDAEEGRVVTRFAPNPDFVIHLGNARPALLSYEYAVMYRGKMILRFEDTDPRIKTPLPEAYELIREDLKWLGIRWDEEYIQSLRMHIYYDIARKLIEVGGAYVDDRSPEEFRRYRDEGRLEDYPPRKRSVEENLELWDKMVSGAFGEGEAVLRVKTDPRHPDPSVRDWVAFRIIDTSRYPHPLVGDRYVAWPTYNFAAAVDDKLMGVTHILRAKEHMQNTIKQQFLYKHLGWSYPHVVHFGRLKLEGFIMSKSTLKRFLDAGISRGIDDPRFATIAGLRRRGIVPEAIKKLIMEVGVKYTDASISYDNLAAINRSIIDPRAKRIMAALSPVPVEVEGLPWREKEFRIPFHPSGQLGERIVKLAGPKATIYVSQSDAVQLAKGNIVRLMEAFNIEVLGASPRRVRARYHSLTVDEARQHNAPIIQWVPATDNIAVEVLKPEGLDLVQERGLAEPAAAQLKPGEIIQLVRIGFARVDSVETDEKGKVRKVVLIYAHD